MSRSLNSTGSTVGDAAADGGTAGTALHCVLAREKKNVTPIIDLM